MASRLTPGIRDVAQLAAVSVGTVSRVINNHPSVTQETRTRVQAVIDSLRYTPDPFARSLRSKASRLIGIIIPELTNPFFAELVQAAESAARKHEHGVIFMTSFDDVQTEADRIALLASRKVDGVVLVPSGAFRATRVAETMRMVMVDRLPAGHPGFAADHRGGARMAVEHLIELGHRRIACIAGPNGLVPARDRLQGYLDAIGGCAAAGEPIVAEGAFDYASGRAAAADLLACPRDERPTAIFASSDQQAIGCLRAARDLGIPVPAGLSVVGFDGVPLSALVTPSLTTVLQPVAAIAEAAIAALLGHRPMPDAVHPLLFDGTLLRRESSAPPARRTLR